jgi:hypothetical protein
MAWAAHRTFRGNSKYDADDVDTSGSTQLQRLRQLFEGALQVAPEHRLEWLREACGGDSQLLDNVKDLLDANSFATRGLGPSNTDGDNSARARRAPV